MKLIGLVGGIASGKSFVARELCQLGAERFDADCAGHLALQDPTIQNKLIQRWGNSILVESELQASDSEVKLSNKQQQIDRKKVAKIVFEESPQGALELAFLESVTHPFITQQLKERREELEKKDIPVMIVDAPILLKAGWDSFCDQIWFVDCPQEVRLARARERGWSEAEFLAREQAQLSMEVKRSRADQIIVNGGSIQNTQQAISDLWQQLASGSPN